MINFKLKIILVTSNELRHRYIQTFVYNLKKITTELIIKEQQRDKHKKIFGDTKNAIRSIEFHSD